MGADSIEVNGVFDDPCRAVRGEEVPFAWRDHGAIVALYADDDGTTLDAKDAVALGRFLLEAAGVDLVGAARRVVEAQGRHVRVGLGLEPGDEEVTPAEHAEAINALAAELAKLEGGA